MTTTAPSPPVQESEKLPAIDQLAINGHADKITEPAVKTQDESKVDSTPATTEHANGSTVPPTTKNEPAPSGPLSIPFASPEASCKPETRPPLTPEQNAKYDSMLETVRGWTSLPTSSATNAPTEPLTESERMWLTRECLLRYLRATTWNTANALKRLQSTMVWRRSYQVESKLTADYISEEMETGKEIIFGFDNAARPCVYLDPGKQNTKKSPRQIEGLVFMLERGIDLMVPGQESMLLIINFKNATSSKSPSVGQGKQTLDILQNHYPERLGKSTVSELPWYIAAFFKLIGPFIDPVTRSKIVFNEAIRDKYVPAAQLWSEYGGDADLVYDHSKFWPAFNKLCDERRAKLVERWEAGGKQIGEYEAYLRGGEQKPLREVQADTTAA